MDPGHLFNTVREKNILILVKRVRNTIQDYCNRGQNQGNMGERWDSTLNTVKTARNLQPKSSVCVCVLGERKMLRGDIKDRGILA